MPAKRRITAWAKTDVGRKRTHNEDFYLLDRSVGLYAVADGMGGYQAGDVASEMALNGLHQRLLKRPDLFSSQLTSAPEQLRHAVRDYLDNAVQEISLEIFQLSQKQGKNFRMGTTLCALVIIGDVGIVVHVGDSRCYLWRDNKLYQATEDHSLVQEQLNSGLISPEEAASSRYKNVITRAVGMAERLQVDLFFVDLQDGDRFLLCSDGLHGYFRNEELGQYLKIDNLDVASTKLIDVANQRGGKDNITVVMVAVEGQSFSISNTQINAGIDILKHNPLFEGMTYAEILKIIPLTSIKNFNAGQTVMVEGAPAEFLYIVQSGSLDIFQSGELISTLGAGDYVGEIGVFDDGIYGATVVAKEQTRCLAIRSADLLDIIQRETVLGFKIQQSLIKALSRRLRLMTSTLAWTRQEWRRSLPPSQNG